MAWELTKEKASWDWPAELSSGAYKKADKHALFNAVLNSLDDAEKFTKTIKVPIETSNSNPNLLALYEKDVAAFIAGPAKKLGGSLAVVKTRVAKAEGDKEVAKSKTMKDALGKISKAITANAQCVQAGVLRSQADKLIAEANKRMAAVLKQRLGGVVTNWKSVTSRGHKELKTAVALLKGLETSKARDKDVATIETEVYTAARDMTTQSVTLVKALNSGVSVPGLTPSDVNAVTAMNKILVPYGNAKQGWSNGGDIKVLAAGIKNVSAQAQLFDQIGKRFAL